MVAWYALKRFRQTWTSRSVSVAHHLHLSHYSTKSLRRVCIQRKKCSASNHRSTISIFKTTNRPLNTFNAVRVPPVKWTLFDGKPLFCNKKKNKQTKLLLDCAKTNRFVSRAFLYFRPKSNTTKFSVIRMQIIFHDAILHTTQIPPEIISNCRHRYFRIYIYMYLRFASRHSSWHELSPLWDFVSAMRPCVIILV